MSINIKEYFIAENLPESLNDRNIKDIAKVTDEFLYKVDSLIEKVLIYPRIDEIDDEDLINHVGFQQHIENFDTSLPLSSKRELIKNSFLLHKLKGTRWAVETALTQFFGNADTPEWFEYGGDPYFFKILHDITEQDRQYDNATIKHMKQIATSYKNLRSWLDLIVFILHLQDEVNLPEELTKFNLDLNYADVIPYRQHKTYKYGKDLIYGHFKYGTARTFDIDDFLLNIGLNFADRYEGKAFQYGRFKYGRFAKYGAKLILPVDVNTKLALQIKNSDEISKPNEHVNFDLNLNFVDKYAHSLKYGHFKYGPATTFGSNTPRPRDDGAKFNLNLQLRDSIAVEESGAFIVTKRFSYGRNIKFGHFKYSPHIMKEVW